MASGRKSISAGRFIEPCSGGTCATTDLKKLMSDQGKQGYDFIIACVTHPRCVLDLGRLRTKAQENSDLSFDEMPNSIFDKLLPTLSVADMALKSSDWTRFIVVKPSPWIDCDSDDPFIRRLSERALKQELSYFAYLSVPAVVIPLRRAHNPNLSRIVYEQIVTSCTHGFWMDVQMVPTDQRSASDRNGSNQYPDLETPRGQPTPHSSSATILKNKERMQQSATTPNQRASGEQAHMVNGTSNHNGEMGNEIAANEPPVDVAGVVNKTTDEEEMDSWNWFYEFRRACNNHRNIQCVLEVTPDLPERKHEIARWKGEPIAAIKFNTRTFLTNNARYPVLPQAHQKVAKDLFKLNTQVLVDGEKLHVRLVRKPRKNDTEPPKPVDPRCLYHFYLDDLWKNRGKLPYLTRLCFDTVDTIHLPMAPLQQNLSADSYHLFEMDPIKYKEYKSAMDRVLTTMMWNNNGSFPEHLTVMVLGAGRGPLVTVAYEVLKKFNLNFTLIAVEKNPCAIMTLKDKVIKEWNNEVELVHTDMRSYQPEKLADIVISELLGGFGCNELSPECLDGALHLMAPNCISIPCHYRSYVSPIHSPKIMNSIISSAERETDPLVAYETPYICRALNYFEIAGAQQLFRFDHPNWKQTSTERYAEVQFVARETSELVGFNGFFYARLSTGASLSTVPKYETPRLSSWFPMLFPMPHPIVVKKGEIIRARFWRHIDERRVWYEWQLASPVVTPIMNPLARSSSMRLVG